jgi:antitoxin MazE
MTGHKLMLEIPDNLFQKLHHLAELTGQSIESLAVQSLTNNLPVFSEKKYNLDDLLSRVSSENLHNEIDTAEPVGRECF